MEIIKKFPFADKLINETNIYETINHFNNNIENFNLSEEKLKCFENIINFGIYSSLEAISDLNKMAVRPTYIIDGLNIIREPFILYFILNNIQYFKNKNYYEYIIKKYLEKLNLGINSEEFRISLRTIKKQLYIILPLFIILLNKKEKSSNFIIVHNYNNIYSKIVINKEFINKHYDMIPSSFINKNSIYIINVEYDYDVIKSSKPCTNEVDDICVLFLYYHYYINKYKVSIISGDNYDFKRINIPHNYVGFLFSPNDKKMYLKYNVDAKIDKNNIYIKNDDNIITLLEILASKLKLNNDHYDLIEKIDDIDLSFFTNIYNYNDTIDKNIINKLIKSLNYNIDHPRNN